MSISKIKESAKTALAGKWGKGIGILFAYLGFSFLVGFITGIITGIVGKESILVTLLKLATSIIEVPITFGLAYSFIKLKRNEEVKAFEFLNLGFTNFGRAWKIALRTILKMILPFVGMIIGLMIIIGGGVYSSIYSTAAATVGGLTSAAPSLGLMLVGLLVYIVSGIWLIVRSLLYSLTTYVAYDNENINSLEVVNESAKMMKGNRGKIFLLELSFVVWYIIPVVLIYMGLAIPGLLSLLAIYVWLFPYMQVAYVCFYDELSGKNTDNNIVSNTEGNVDTITEM